MLGRVICCVVVGTCLASSALATGTVSLLLESPVAGQTISAGATVNWSVKVSVSTGDNVGLALIACDLVQSASNPAKFDLPPGSAASIPGAMTNFNRPAGIANPGEGANPSGYVGVQRGTAGQMNLVQIGGAQNTFGTAMSPGSGIGENAIVTSGIGQGGSAQLVLSGSFPAPATQGAYTFSLQNGVANVLTSVGTPPQFSPVRLSNRESRRGQLQFHRGSADLPWRHELRRRDQLRRHQPLRAVPVQFLLLAGDVYL